MTHHTAADLIRLTPTRRERLTQIRDTLARLTQPGGSGRSPLTRRQWAKQQRNQHLINRLEAEAHHLEQLLNMAAPLIRQQTPRSAGSN